MKICNKTQKRNKIKIFPKLLEVCAYINKITLQFLKEYKT